MNEFVQRFTKREDCLAEVRHIVSNLTQISLSEKEDDSDFIDDLFLDSIQIIELVVEMEDRFSLRIGDEEAESLRTVQALASYVYEKLED